MRAHSSTVAIVPGTGIVARFGDVVIYLAGETPSTDRLLGAVETVALSTAASAPGAALAQRLAGVVFGGASAPPPFGVLAPTADGMLILLRGAVIAEVSGAEGNRRVAGDRAFTWVDEIIREPVRRIAIGAEMADPTSANPRTDLRAGIVTGNGFVLTMGRKRNPAPRRVETIDEPAPTEATGFRALRDTGARADGSGTRPPTASLQVAEAPGTGFVPTADVGSSESETVSTGARPSTIEGETVSTGPRNSPATSAPLAWSQALDAAKLAEPVALGKSGQSSPRGALVTEDGLSYPLDRSYVLGRNPSGDESVRAAAATPILIERDRLVSRVHAFVAPERGKVFVREAPATSGTFFAAPDSERWSRVGTLPIELQPGWRLRINDFLLTYCV
ncbi:FHA domain-containing protein [Nocardia neocaledoniensis]|uniref:FHA domain-containing protein n=1 Tax=Nocardia neocaledoniensis TaxID=236511 RepID=UPI00245396EC|nr:FHA domain-containing protein [Nocardia neocaledoniensis]